MTSVSAPPAALRPKICRLPPAGLSLPVKPLSTARSNRLWRWSACILALVLVWPTAEKQATAYLKLDTLKTFAEPGDFEGILQPPLADAQAALPAERPSTILLRGQSEAIIGQMAKIPAENEPIIETQAVSEVDNNAARELLSIISKY